MNGLVICRTQGPAALLDRVRRIQKQLDGGVFSAIVDDVLVARLCTTAWEVRASESLYHDEVSGIVAVVDGYFRVSLEAELSSNIARQLVQLYLEKGATSIDDLSGEFVCALYDPRHKRIIVANDRFGLRPVYCGRTLDGFMCASGPRYFVKTGFMKPRLNRVFALNYLLLNKCRPGVSTIFEGIELLPAATVRTVTANHVEDRRYWTFSLSEEAQGGIDPKALGTIYRRAVQRCVTSHAGKYVVSLSGGLDSRSILAALDPACRGRVGSMTWAVKESDEARLSAQTARLAGIAHDLIPVGPRDFVDFAHTGFRVNDELDLFVQGVTAKGCRAMVGRYDVAVMGPVLDATLGGSHLKPEVFELKTKTDVLDHVIRVHGLIANVESVGLQNSGLMRECREAVRENLATAIASLPQDTAPALYDLFFLVHAAHRVIFHRYRFYRHFLETSTPMYDYEFVDGIRTVGMRLRAGHRFYRDWLVGLSPKLARIPYQWTLLPADVPVEYWPRANAIQHELASLIETINLDRPGSAGIDYARHYSNWLAWSRRESVFREYLAAPVESKDEPIYDFDLVDRDRFRALWQAHQDGKANYSQLFLHTVSLNGFLREYF